MSRRMFDNNLRWNAFHAYSDVINVYYLVSISVFNEKDSDLFSKNLGWGKINYSLFYPLAQNDFGKKETFNIWIFSERKIDLLRVIQLH